MNEERTGKCLRTFPWFSSFLVSSNPLSRKSRQALDYRINWERYTPYVGLLECCYIWMESSQWENWNHLFCRKVSFLTAPHCQFRGVGQGMKQTYLYLYTFPVNTLESSVGWGSSSGTRHYYPVMEERNLCRNILNEMQSIAESTKLNVSLGFTVIKRLNANFVLGLTKGQNEPLIQHIQCFDWTILQYEHKAGIRKINNRKTWCTPS